MGIRTLILSTSLLFAAATAQAVVPLIPIEEGFETFAKDIRLPEDGTGLVQLIRCPGCEPVIVRITEETTIFVGEQRAPYKVMHELAVGDKVMVIFYRLEDNVVSRIVLDEIVASAPRDNVGSDRQRSSQPTPSRQPSDEARDDSGNFSN